MKEVLDNKAVVPAVSMDSFYPALVQCFGIIILGYIAGRYNIVTKADSHGLAKFTGKFSLPALIFTSLVDLKWGSVNWTFLLSILLAKTIVYIVVLLISVLVVRPLDLGRGGLYAIFCTQSNDFAVGYPILQALYSNVHPEYISYLYLLVPTSMAILNPVGFLLMEIARIMRSKKDDPTASNEKTPTKRFIGKRMMLGFNVLRSLFINPLLVMTILGLASSFVFTDGLPEIIGSLLDSLGKAFSATALFLLGLKIVGQGSSLRGNGLLLPIILVIAKIFRSEDTAMRSGRLSSTFLEEQDF